MSLLDYCTVQFAWSRRRMKKSNSDLCHFCMRTELSSPPAYDIYGRTLCMVNPKVPANARSVVRSRSVHSICRIPPVITIPDRPCPILSHVSNKQGGAGGALARPYHWAHAYEKRGRTWKRGKKEQTGVFEGHAQPASQPLCTHWNLRLIDVLCACATRANPFFRYCCHIATCYAARRNPIPAHPPSPSRKLHGS